MNTRQPLYVLAISALAAGAAFSQTPEAKPTFEVASLKEVSLTGPAVDLSIAPRRTPGRFTWNTTLGLMLSYAYHLPMWRILRKDQDRSFYSVTATLDPSATEDQARLMLQALLVERLKIASHREPKVSDGYALVVAKGGPKLKTANAAGEAPAMPEYWQKMPAGAYEGRVVSSVELGGDAITGRGVSVAQLADELGASMGATVVDRTGLTGKYYFGFKFLSIKFPESEPEAPSIFAAVQEELGLKLEKQKVPVEILVIDHIEKPAEN